MVTDTLSISMTILRSLQLAYGDTHLSTMARVEVHVIGSETDETYMAEERYHEIFHWLPACRELYVYFIAPTANAKEPGAPTRSYSAQPNKVCQACAKVGAEMHLRHVHGFYHEVAAPVGTTAVQNLDNKLLLDRVSLAIACNSGIHDHSPNPSRPSYASTWEPTIQLLLAANIPCVFTSYNEEESVQDRRVLVQLGANIVADAQVNPFRGLRPFPDIGEDNTFYYSNQSFTIVRGKV